MRLLQMLPRVNLPIPHAISHIFMQIFIELLLRRPGTATCWASDRQMLAKHSDRWSGVDLVRRNTG